MRFDKRACFTRAKALLEESDDSKLHYVCLELRFTIEAVAYEKIRTYSARLPQEILETWQPPQVLKALKEFEPNSTEDFVLYSRRENENGSLAGPLRIMGTHRGMKLPWLRKTYNKLGNYLHVPLESVSQSTKEQDTTVRLRPFLEKIVSDLEPIVATTLDSSLAGIIDFECVKCGKTIIRNEEGAREKHDAVCQNQNCKAEYYIEFHEDDTFEPRLKAIDFNCASCGNAVEIENRLLKIGFEFRCGSCGARHQIAGRQWEYGMLVENETATSSR